MATMSSDIKPGTSVKMESFHWSRNVMNKFLRRSFLDGVMALYETASEVRVHSVELRGSLTLTINKGEEFTIRLNESAQRMPEDNEYASEPEDTEIRDKRGWELGCESPSGSKRMKREVKEEVKTASAIPAKSDSPAATTAAAAAAPLNRSRTPSPADKTRASDPAQSKASPSQRQDGSHGGVSDSHDGESSRSRSRSRSRSSSEDRGICRSSDSSSVAKTTCIEVSRMESNDQSQVSAGANASASRSLERTAVAEDYRSGKNKPPDASQKPSKPLDDSYYIYIDDDDDDKVKSEPAEERPACSRQLSQFHSSTALASPPGRALPDARHAAHAAANMVFPCILCNELFQGQGVLGMHMEYHRQNFGQFCLTCASGKLSPESSVRHMVAAHGPAAAADRQSIAMTTNTVTMTTNHSSTTAPGLQCEECGKAFPTIHELLVHLPSHMEAPLCELCQESFASAEALEAHRRSQHAGSLVASDSQVLPADLFCSLCQASFPSVQLFQDHLLQYHTPTEGSFTCSLCRQPFKHWSALRQHLAAEHNQLHFCNLCQEAFGTDLQLLDHHILQHSLAPSLAPGADSDYETGQVFRCEICFKTFPTLQHCNVHKQSHGLSKPFACSTCGSSFLKKGDLTKHIRTVHSTQRPFLCVLCGKTGTRMDNMRSHVRIHKKSMPREELESYITDLRKASLSEGEI